jgi:PAS domain S-box-containing protein
MTHEHLDPSLFRLLLDETLDWETFHDPDGKLVYSSPASRALIGYGPDDILADPSLFWHRVHAEDLDIVRGHEQAVARAHRAGEMTFRYTMHDGSVRWIYHKCGPIFDGQGHYIGQRGSNRDVTALKRTERDLEQRVRMLRGITSLSSQLIQLPLAGLRSGITGALELVGLIAEVDRVSIMEFDEGDADIFRVTYQWSSGTIGDRVPGEVPGTITARLPWLAAQMRERQLVWIDNGADFPTEAVEERALVQTIGFTSNLVVPIMRGDTVVGGLSLTMFTEQRAWTTDVIVFLRIIADLVSAFLLRMHDEERSQRQTAELQNAYAALEMASQAKDNFLSSMSHELRTPLTNVLGLAEVLGMQNPPLTPRQLHFVGVITESGQHLLAMINDILDMAKIESGTISIDPVACDLRQVATTATHIVQQLVERHRHTLVSRIELDDPMITADPLRVKQMITNLLSNAIKFTPDGGSIELAIAPDLQPGSICISVRDSGIGIAADDMHKLFNPFSQLDTRLSKSTGGTGLGLTLVKRMAEMHGGSVSVESEPNVGSIFRIHLPR